jgi:hypothetical protein
VSGGLTREACLRAPAEVWREPEGIPRVRAASVYDALLRRNFELFSASDWLAALTVHIPNAGEHLVRYYGCYSNVSRWKRREVQGEVPTNIKGINEVSASVAKRAWARLIKQVYEVDPLVCPLPGPHSMRVRP